MHVFATSSVEQGGKGVSNGCTGIVEHAAGIVEFAAAEYSETLACAVRREERTNCFDQTHECVQNDLPVVITGEQCSSGMLQQMQLKV
jgi:hypothetical protein